MRPYNLTSHRLLSMSSQTDMTGSSIAAVDYIANQLQLEREARELMPYDPKDCTYEKGALRQPVFACLTCSRANDNEPIGVCYSCSIQCHSTHEIVELFSKREFACDCGTTKVSRIPNNACKLRVRDTNHQEPLQRPRTGSTASTSSQTKLEFDAEDIPSLTNSYNHNYQGLFCSCKKPYNPLEEDGNMIQCYFGFSCGEDWFHEDCILGYQSGSFSVQPKVSHNKLDELPPPGEDASSENKSEAKEIRAEATEIKSEATENSKSHLEIIPTMKKVPDFPNLDDFDLFICWKCVLDFSTVFEEIRNDNLITFKLLPHFENITSPTEWTEKYREYRESQPNQDSEPSRKRLKVETLKTHKETPEEIPYSVFLQPNFRDRLNSLSKLLPETSKLGQFLHNHQYLYKDDPVFEPPEEEDDDSSATGSLLDLGAGALLSLPREKAIEGLQAYDKIRTKLRDFFKPFAEQGKVVTEEEVRDFFGSIKKEK